MPQARHLVDDAPQAEEPLRRHGAVGVEPSEELESENTELKRLLADAMPDNADPRAFLQKTSEPAARRSAARVLIEDRGFAERRGCRLAGVSRSSFRRKPVPRPRAELRKRMAELANRHMQLGYRKLHGMLVR